MVRVAAPTMLGDLDGVLGQYVAKAKEQGQQPFALGQYATLPMSAAPQCKGLLALAEVLRALLVVSPAAIINFKELERALSKLDEQYSLRPAALSRAQWASVTACQLRVALSHLRKLKQRSKLWDQRSRELTDHGRQVLGDLLAQHTPLGTVPAVEASPEDGALGTEAVGTGSEQGPSSPGPTKRSKCQEVGSPDFSQLVGTQGTQQHSSTASASETSEASSTGNSTGQLSGTGAASSTGNSIGQLSGTGASSSTGKGPRRLTGTEVAALLQALASQPVQPTERALLGQQLAAKEKAKRQDKVHTKRSTGQKTKKETKKQTKLEQPNKKVKKENKKNKKETKETKKETKDNKVTKKEPEPTVYIKQEPLLATKDSPDPALGERTEPSVWEGGLARFAPLSVHTASAGQGRTYIQAKVMGQKVLVCEISGNKAGDKHKELALQLRKHIEEKNWTKEEALAWRKDVVGY